MKQQKNVPNSANIESFCIKDDSQKYKPYSEICKALHRLSGKEQSSEHLYFFVSLRKVSLRKNSIMENPFKFVSLVDTPYFTDRVKEVDNIVQFLKSENHLVLMSPQRFGKSSLVKKAVTQTQRPYLWLNIQARWQTRYRFHSNHQPTMEQLQ